MNPIPHCGTCGAPLPEGSAGQCPLCLLGLGLATGDASDTGASAGVLPVLRYFGDYELLEEIARGGMGVVYRARQISLNRTVAVKMILAGHFAGSDAVKRFRAEAEAAAGLRHPHIVAIHEVGEHEGQQYFSMDYIEGRNLAEVMATLHRTSGDLRRIAGWMQTVAKAIHYAHDRGVLHRDLKPSNILLDAAGEPHITDFGLAKRLTNPPAGTPDADLTTTGQVLGSPNYMSPEQASGKRSGVGPASDVYALGAILYHLMTGRGPFVSDTVAETLHQVLHDEPVTPRLLNLAVPRDLETICLKCLEKEPVRRYGTACELADELGRFLREEPIQARPVGRSEKLWRWGRRKPALAGSLAAAAALLLIVAIGSPLALFRINREWRRAEQNARNETTQRQAADTARRRAEREQYLSNIRLAAAYVESGAHDRAIEMLTNCPAEHRNWEWGRLVYLSRQALVDTSWSGWTYHHPQFSPHGGCFAFLEPETHRFRLFNLVSGRELAIPVAGTRVAAVWENFSPDDKFFATAQSTELQIWSTDSGAKLQSIPIAMKNVSSCQFWLDGRAVVLWSDAGALEIWDWAAQNQLLSLSETQRVVSTSVRSVSSRLALGFKNGHIRFWDAASKQLSAPLGVDSRGLSYLRLSRDARQLIAVGKSGVTIRDAATGERLYAPIIPKGQFDITISDLEYRRYLTRDSKGKVQLWDAATGDEIMVLPVRISSETKAQFSRNGQWLIIVDEDQSGTVWEAQTGRLALRLPQAMPYSATDVEFSDDGQRMFVLGSDNIARVRDLRGEEFLAVRPTSIPYPGEIGPFSSDGRRLAHLTGQAQTNGLKRLKIWNADPGRDILRGSDGDWILAVAFSPDGRHLASAHWANEAWLWDVESGQRVRRLHGHLQIVFGVAFSPDGRQLVTVSGDKTAKVWDVETGRELLTLRGHSRRLGMAAFSPDGSLIATGSSDGTTKVWDARTGRSIVTLGDSQHPVRALTWSRDGRALFTGSDGAITRWDPVQGRSVWSTNGHTDTIAGLALCPDGKAVASASFDQTVRFWDVRDGQEARQPLRGRQPFRALAFAGDGRRIITGNSLNMFYFRNSSGELWDVESGRELLTLQGSSALIGSVAFSSDGLRIASGEFEGMARVWEAFPWKEEQYPGSLEMPLAERIDRYAQDYWRKRLTAESKGRSLSSGADQSAKEKSDPEFWRPPRSSFPSRDTQAPSSLIDLTDYYNGLLSVMWQPGRYQGEYELDYSALTTGLVLLKDTLFDIRGAIQLARSDPDWTNRFPVRVNGIGVHQKCHRLQFLHAFQTIPGINPKSGTIVGAYRAHFVSGLEEDIPIRYGTDLRHCVRGEANPAPPDGNEVWRGMAPAGMGMSLYQKTWTNPRPDDEILSIDFVSAVTNGGPFLVALTAERDDQVMAVMTSHLQRLPDTADAWRTKARVFERLHRLNDALDAYSKVIEKLGPNDDPSSFRLAPHYTDRARVLQAMGRTDEAVADVQRSHRIPPRNPNTPARLIDLGVHYNAGLTENWHTGSGKSDLSSLPVGVQHLAEVDFDLRGIVQVGDASRKNAPYPETVTGIQVHQKARRLHFLHAAVGVASASNGMEIGRYCVHLANGSQHSISLIVGQNIGHWRTQSDEGKKPWLVAWQSADDSSENSRHAARLFKLSWDNPEPVEVIESIDLLQTSGQTGAPFIVAITAE